MQLYHFPVPVPDFIVSIHIWLRLRFMEMKHNCKLRAIKLTLGKYAIVSLEDYERLNQHRWRALRGPKCFYAVRSKKRRIIYMHNEVISPLPGFVADHIDHDGLNNSRHNLQLATRSQNAYNRRKRTTKCTSKYKGVWFNKREKKWISAIKYEGKLIFLGYFDNEIEAARAYDAAAKIHHKEFAVLNFPNAS
ncbi:MAG: hypothetical protein CVV39_04980 [Planctomycetes bacterium HGW-Planctomycetes-1]|nr:MAG: hypothetical protein CVV39_04980 [Planctomycetes bacterium HGW-Planctomycetes-1]